MIKRLLNWLDESTCNFMAVAAMERELLAAGFQKYVKRTAGTSSGEENISSRKTTARYLRS